MKDIRELITMTGDRLMTQMVGQSLASSSGNKITIETDPTIASQLRREAAIGTPADKVGMVLWFPRETVEAFMKEAGK